MDTATGDTIYTFLMSATQLTATRQDDPATQNGEPRALKLLTYRVSNTIYAFQQCRFQQARNAYYITDASYADADSTGAVCDASTCDSTIGPEHPCPSASELANTQIKSLEYKINLDMRDVVASTTSGTTTSYFGVATISDIAVGADNCYKAAPVSVSIETDSPVTRSSIVFRTACANLKNGTSALDEYSTDTFAHCKAAYADSTNFDFAVQLYECTNAADLSDPASGPSVKSYDTLKIILHLPTLRIQLQLNTRLLTQASEILPSPDHRNIDGTHVRCRPSTWRDTNALESSVAEPYITYSPQSFLLHHWASARVVHYERLNHRQKMCAYAVSRNSALASIATDSNCCAAADIAAGTCTLRECAVACTEQNTLIDKTHSPYARWGRNTKLGGDRGCADPNASPRCNPTVYSSTYIVPPEFTCQRSNWEDFLIAEANAILLNIAVSEKIKQDLGNLQAITVGSMAQGFDPVIEAQLIIQDGATTDMAENIYGTCEER